MDRNANDGASGMTVEATRDGALLEVRLTRPAKKNALTESMYGAIADALDLAERDPSVRVVLLHGSGDDFCAGNDLDEFAAVSQGGGAGMEQVKRMLHAFAAATKPIVAAVQGAAVGVGTTLLLHCDLVYVAEDARIAAPFVNLALVPEAASSTLLPAAIGYRLAFEMFALGRTLSGEEAVRFGLANAAGTREAVLAMARQAARTLATRAPGSLAATKRLMRDPPAYLARMSEEMTVFEARLHTAEAREAFAAFREKRTPDFARC